MSDPTPKKPRKAPVKRRKAKHSPEDIIKAVGSAASAAVALAVMVGPHIRKMMKGRVKK